MVDQYKDLETPEEAFAALLAQSKGGPVVEYLASSGPSWKVCSGPSGWDVGSIVNAKFRVPLPPVVTVVYHVHDRTGAHIGSRTNYAEAAERASPWEGSYIVKHTITNGVPSVEVVK